MQHIIDNLPLRNSARVEDFTGIELPEILEKALDSILSLNNVPGIPIELEGIPSGVAGLLKRDKELALAREQLTTEYTIGGFTDKAENFLFGNQDLLKQVLSLLASKDLQHLTQVSRVNTLVRDEKSLFEDDVTDTQTSLTKLFLDTPEQWEVSLTNYRDVRARALENCGTWKKVLTDPGAATEQFWPMIAENGLAYNLLFLRKLQSDDHERLQDLFGDDWNSAWESAGDIFFIDLTIFSKFKPAEVHGFPRFTPGSLVVLKRDGTGTLLPIAVRLSGYKDRGVQAYLRETATDEAWLYALMAAKTAVTVYGIWLGHVYHWHIVTAAMLMGFLNRISDGHPLYAMIKPQSHHLIAFDQILLLIWKHIAPPTSFENSWDFLKLMDAYGEGRDFFDDDPRETLKRHGIVEADFTVQEPWDRYPIVARFLAVWDSVEAYVDTVVDHLYADDTSVANDAELQAWMEECRDPQDGNISGIPIVNSRARLKRVLTSLLYRITMHGCSRLERSLSPAYSYVPNYPVCLQRTDIPGANDKPQLMSYMPNTGTMGTLFNFYGIFIFSKPYQPLIAGGDPSSNLFFDNDVCNNALMKARKEILAWMEVYQPGEQSQLEQWPMSIET